MARSDAIRENALHLSDEAQQLLDADDGSPKTHAQIEELTSRSERLMAQYGQVRAEKQTARDARRGPTPLVPS
jgi:hypothetical protein